MIDIEFRANNTCNEFLYSNDFESLAEYFEECDMHGWQDHEQYTGFKDKNDKKMFAGDIAQRKVRRSDYYPEQPGRYPEHKETKTWIETEEGIITMSPEVRFNGELLCGKLYTESELSPRQIVRGWDYEVIGNIHTQ